MWRLVLVLGIVWGLTGGVWAQDDEPRANEFAPRQVALMPRGATVYPAPDKSEKRLFAIQSQRFMPFVGGVSDNGEFYWVFYFDRGELMSGWIPLDQLDLAEWSYQDLLSLPIITEAEAHHLPKLDFVPSANRQARFP